MAGRVQAVVFDVLETVLDLDPIGGRLEEVGASPEVLGPFFMRFQRDAMALSLAGDTPDFTATAAQALRTETAHTLTETEVAHVLEGFASVPAFPDAAPAFRLLRDAGVTVACLTVGDPDNTRSFLHRAGLDRLVDHVVTTDLVGTWKPAPSVYRYTAETVGCETGRTALVAVHAWDCHGARRAGALAGWCSRLEGARGEVFLPADVEGADLVEVVQGLLRL